METYSELVARYGEAHQKEVALIVEKFLLAKQFQLQELVESQLLYAFGVISSVRYGVHTIPSKELIEDITRVECRLTKVAAIIEIIDLNNTIEPSMEDILFNREPHWAPRFLAINREFLARIAGLKELIVGEKAADLICDVAYTTAEKIFDLYTEG